MKSHSKKQTKARVYVAVAAAILSVCATARGQEVVEEGLAGLPLDPIAPLSRPEIPGPAAPTTEPAAPPTTAEAAAEKEAAPDAVSAAIESMKKPLTDHGITPQLSLVAEWGKNLHGGASTNGSAFDYLVNFNITVDTEQAFGWKGGTFFVNFQHQHGESASVDAGDFQDVSGIDADGRTQLAELWYQQQLLDHDKLRVKIGKIDVGGEFGYALNGEEFVNLSLPWTASNLVMPTYPDPSLGVMLVARPNDSFYISGGAFDGALANGVRTGENGPHTLWHPPGDLFAIGEAGLTWDGGESGRLGRFALGAWHHTATFDRFNGGTQDGGSGFYAIFEQVLWRENPTIKDDAQGLGLFVIYDYAEADVFPVDHHIGAGVQWTGIIDRRDTDIAGLGITWSHFSHDAGFDGNNETAFECFYKIQITPWISVKPDVQYIVTPSGSERNALVGIVQVEMEF